jgi:hypothetical protein
VTIASGAESTEKRPNTRRLLTDWRLSHHPEVGGTAIGEIFSAVRRARPRVNGLEEREDNRFRVVEAAEDKTIIEDRRLKL